jgi:hypothetical protein
MVYSMTNRATAAVGAVLLCLGTMAWLSRPVAAVTRAVTNRTAGVARGRLFDRDALISIDTARTEGASSDALRLALNSVACASSSGAIERPATLTLIDYSRPSVEPRLWVFDLRSGELLFKELVAHGRNSGESVATRFSDDVNSLSSSLGLFVARDSYDGKNGYSLRLDGLEPGFNAHARERGIVVHGASYVDSRFAADHGRIGRSWGCPVVRPSIARKLIDTIRNGGVVFAYYPHSIWLGSSRFLNSCSSTLVVANN